MTRNRLIALGQNRARLIGRARVEREQLAAQVAQIESALSWVEIARKGAQEARRHKLIILLAIAVVVAVRPRNALSLAIRGLSLWRLYKRGQRLWTLAMALAGSSRQPSAT